MRASAEDFSKASKSKDCIVYTYDGYTSYLLIVDEASHYIWVFLTSSKDLPLDSFRLLYGCMVTLTVVRSEQIKVENSLGAMLFRRCCFRTTVTHSNLPDLTAPLRMVPWKYITTNLGSRRGPSCMALASRHSTGLLPFATLYTSTTASSIMKLK
jgi:hypothetical protein